MTSKRILRPPKGSFFLLGPRATGKSTWVRDELSADFSLDLLRAREFQQYSIDPGLLGELIKGNPNWKCIVIDEIQKLPELLDEVHAALFESKNTIQFVLTGSSARKLKKKNVNLLAGRALVRYFHPFSAFELGKKFDLDLALKFGMLPQVWNLPDIADKIDYLYAYVDTYLKEEIQQEAVVRSLPPYLKFLEHFALRSGQVINLQNISQEAGVPRTTINGYLDVLEQTLVGRRLEPIHLKAKVKEVSTAKFYFFDNGVTRTLARQVGDDLDVSKGFHFESLVLHELTLYSDYHAKRWEIHYWGTPSENEVDFIISQGSQKIGIEVKTSSRWEAKYNTGLNTLLEAKKIKRAFGVYLGADSLKKGEVMVFSFKRFIQELHAGKLMS